MSGLLSPDNRQLLPYRPTLPAQRPADARLDSTGHDEDPAKPDSTVETIVDVITPTRSESAMSPTVPDEAGLPEMTSGGCNKYQAVNPAFGNDPREAEPGEEVCEQAVVSGHARNCGPELIVGVEQQSAVLIQIQECDSCYV